MRIASNLVGGFLAVVGTVWFLQGINILLGSFMTGQPKWAVIGGATFCAGAAILVFVNHRGSRSRASAIGK